MKPRRTPERASRDRVGTKAQGNGRYRRDELNSLEGNIRRLSSDGTIAGAAREAIREQRAAGLAITYKKGNLVIKEYPDGRKEVLDRIPPTARFKLPRGASVIKTK